MMTMQMSNHKTQHLFIIDSLRGLAAVMVCLFHFVCTTTNYIENQTIFDLFSLGKYGLHIFFVISGIVIPLSMVKCNYSINLFSKYLWKRITRIEPPYLVSIILFILYALLRKQFYSSAESIEIPSVNQVLIHLGYLVPFVENGKWFINTYWSLAIEFQYYIVLSLIFPFIVHKNILVRLFFSSLFLFSSLAFPNDSFLPFWTPIFMLGITYITFVHDKISLKEFIIWQTLSLVLIFYLNEPIVSVFCIITMLLVHFFSNFKNRITLFLGKISYSIYLLHGITGGLVINFLSHKYVEPYQKILVIVFGFLVATVCSYLFYLFIEKPSQKWSKNVIL
jgi:peptidoglycan/LPS O-acetylase OafA/YrhL